MTSVPRFPSVQLGTVQVWRAMYISTFPVSEFLEGKGGTFSFVLHLAGELSFLCAGCTMYWIWTRCLVSSLTCEALQGQGMLYVPPGLTSQKFYILPSQCIHMLYMYLRIKSERKSVYWAVRTGSSNKTIRSFSLKAGSQLDHEHSGCSSFHCACIYVHTFIAYAHIIFFYMSLCIVYHVCIMYACA